MIPSSERITVSGIIRESYDRFAGNGGSDSVTSLAYSCFHKERGITMRSHQGRPDFATQCVLSYLADTQDTSLWELVKDAQKQDFPSRCLSSKIRDYVTVDVLS